LRLYGLVDTKHTHKRPHTHKQTGILVVPKSAGELEELIKDYRAAAYLLNKTNFLDFGCIDMSRSLSLATKELMYLT
jgi:hypothetical protein